MLSIIDTPESKQVRSETYNYSFDKKTGFFARWGRSFAEDAKCAPSPEILDIEVSTICHKGCSFCYKSNMVQGGNMSFDTFKAIFDKMPKVLTQIAFGIGDIDANPDLFRMMEYSRSNGVIPNITINGERMTDEYYDKLVSLCGAVAVSLYDKDTCYNAVYELTRRGMRQVNIHALLAKETVDNCISTFNDRKTQLRLADMNAVVFLWMKPIGARNKYHQLASKEKFMNLVHVAQTSGKPFGFDSCSAPMFLEAVKDSPDYAKLETLCEPCESTLFSYYIDTAGYGFPCSFAEVLYESEEWNGVDVAGCQDFIKDVWNAEETKKFREQCIGNCRKCPIYALG